MTKPKHQLCFDLSIPVGWYIKAYILCQLQWQCNSFSGQHCALIHVLAYIAAQHTNLL